MDICQHGISVLLKLFFKSCESSIQTGGYSVWGQSQMRYAKAMLLSRTKAIIVMQKEF